MPQFPTQVPSLVTRGADGYSDLHGPAKNPSSFDTFHLNALCDNQSRNRREGRDFSFIQVGSPMMMIGTMSWEDGVIVNFAASGSVLLDLSDAYTFVVAAGIRYIIQSPDGTWWDCTPNPITAMIFPIILVAAPATPPQTSNLFLDTLQSLVFQGTGQMINLTSDEAHNGPYSLIVNNGTGVTNITSDLVFTFASGYAVRKKDLQGNTWIYRISNDGAFGAITL